MPNYLKPLHETLSDAECREFVRMTEEVTERSVKALGVDPTPEWRTTVVGKWARDFIEVGQTVSTWAEARS